MKKWVIIHLEKFYGINPKFDVVDACIMCYIYDICRSRSPRIIRRKFNGEKYTWVDYKQINKEMPILHIKETNTVSTYNRINKLIKAGLLEKRTRNLLSRGQAYMPYAGNLAPTTNYHRQCFFKVTESGKELYRKEVKMQTEEIPLFLR
ncbi:MAG: hypothetical protein Q8N88_01950 [Nanoarchaeota archaeon]|nr:hypothetical protein [Nanoarchaeota archaeon]